MVSENIEKVIKVETDMLDDCMWESRIEISKDVANENNAELPLESQVISCLNTVFLLCDVLCMFSCVTCSLPSIMLSVVCDLPLFLISFLIPILIIMYYIQVINQISVTISISLSIILCNIYPSFVLP